MPSGWELRHQKVPLTVVRHDGTIGVDFRFGLSLSTNGSRMSQNPNLVPVVDDDPGMLKAVRRLLRQHDYEPILFSSVQAFKNHPAIEKAAWIFLDVNLSDGSGIEFERGLKSRRRLRAGYLHHRQ